MMISVLFTWWGFFAAAVAAATLFDDVKFYSDIGVHRSCMDGDLKTSAWMEKELLAAGFAASLRSYPVAATFDLSDTNGCALTVDGTNIECFPVWLPSADWRVAGVLFSRPAGVPPAGSALVLEVASYTTATAAVNATIQKALDARASAIILINTNNGPGGTELCTLNSPFTATPWPVPIVVVGSKHEAFLASATRLDLLTVGGFAGAGESSNVVGRLFIPGPPPPLPSFNSSRRATNSSSGRAGSKQRRAARHVVVTTPTTGWFKCGGERGPGVALWLQLARRGAALRAQRLLQWQRWEAGRRELEPAPALALRAGNHTKLLTATGDTGDDAQGLGSAEFFAAAHHTELHFVGTSGHELGNLGALLNFEDLAQQGLGPEGGAVAFWVHLGASIAVLRDQPNSRAGGQAAGGGGGGGSGEEGAGGSGGGQGQGGAAGGAGTAGATGACKFSFAQFSTEALGTAVAAPLVRAGFAPTMVNADTAGELEEIVKMGYPAFGFFANFPRFHTEADDEGSTSGACLEQAGEGIGAAWEAALEAVH
jgi:hypothetical protein